MACLFVRRGMGGPLRYEQLLDASAYVGRSVGQQRPGSVRIMTSKGDRNWCLGLKRES